MKDGIRDILIINTRIANNPRHTSKSRFESLRRHSSLVLEIVALTTLVAFENREILAH